MDAIKLPENPAEAFAQIASYLKTARTDRSRAHYHNNQDANLELQGYWQTTDWLEGLANIAKECDRLANALSATPDQSLIWLNCPSCLSKGTTHNDWEKCWSCDGLGKITAATWRRRQESKNKKECSIPAEGQE